MKELLIEPREFCLFKDCYFLNFWIISAVDSFDCTPDELLLLFFFANEVVFTANPEGFVCFGGAGSLNSL
tara:strand:- start:812 stop:1021 length:210 start_codon:yes stop_codon:yes gene_type:complete